MFCCFYLIFLFFLILSFHILDFLFEKWNIHTRHAKRGVYSPLVKPKPCDKWRISKCRVSLLTPWSVILHIWLHLYHVGFVLISLMYSLPLCSPKLSRWGRNVNGADIALWSSVVFLAQGTRRFCDATLTGRWRGPMALVLIYSSRSLWMYFPWFLGRFTWRPTILLPSCLE